MLHRAAKRYFKRVRTGGPPSVIKPDNRWVTDGAPSDKNAIITRNDRGQFQAGTVANPGGLFQPGRSGNPAGRPKGSFRAGARAAAALLDRHAEAFAAKAAELALDGDAVMVRFGLARTVGTRRGQPVELDLTAVAEVRDLPGAVAAVTAAVADGRITPDEALSLSQMLDGFPRVFAAVPPPKPEVDPAQAQAARHRLIDALDRLAAEETLRQSSEALRQSEALRYI
jgi:hypothetical protein